MDNIENFNVENLNFRCYIYVILFTIHTLIIETSFNRKSTIITFWFFQLN